MTAVMGGDVDTVVASIESHGLTAANVRGALLDVPAIGVDVSSGVESSPGIKDHDKLKTFLSEVCRWDSRTN